MEKFKKKISLETISEGIPRTEFPGNIPSMRFLKKKDLKKKHLMKKASKWIILGNKLLLEKKIQKTMLGEIPREIFVSVIFKKKKLSNGIFEGLLLRRNFFCWNVL